MRRLAATLGCLLILASALVVPAAAAPSVRMDEQAVARWVVKQRGGVTIQYGAGFYRIQDPVTGKVREGGGFYKMRCVRNDGMNVCRDMGHERATDFYLDPMLESGWIEGKRGRVEWAANPSVGAFFSEEFCYWNNEQGEQEEAEGRGGGRTAEATATGTILGEDVTALKPARSDAFLSIGVNLTECPF